MPPFALLGEFIFNSFKKTTRLFFPYLIQDKTARLSFLLATIFVVIDILAASLVPHFTKKVVDMLSLSLAEGLGIFIFLVGFFWILEKTSGHFQEIFIFPAINNSIRDITRDVVNHIHQIPLPLYQTLSMPEIISCIKRISFSARSFVKVLFLLVLPTVIKFGIATWAALKLGLLGLTLLPAYALTFILLAIGTRWYIQTREISWQITDNVTMRINDSILNTKMIRPFQVHEMKIVSSLLNQEANLWYKTNTKLHLIHAAIALLLGTVMIFILYQAFLQIQQKMLTVGDFVFIKGLLLALFLPLNSLCAEFRQLCEACVDIKKIADLFDLPVLPLQSQIIRALPSSKGTGLSVNNIAFGYPNQALLLEDLTLQIEEGSKVLILGENGSGKSSLLSLMCGLNKPSQGKISLRECPLEQYPPDQLRQLIYFIPQDFRLFNLSLRDNLTYGLNKVPDPKLNAILESLKIPADLNTQVGEMGIRLSGGEKQRIALARALLLKPDILLCDETLQSLNKESAKEILSLLFKEIPTVILVSHQSWTVDWVDQAYRIHQGKAMLLPQQTMPQEKMAFDLV